VAFIWSPRQLLQSDTGVPHFALDPLTYRCLLSLSPAADFAEPRPPRHNHLSESHPDIVFDKNTIVLNFLFKCLCFYEIHPHSSG